MSIDHERMQAAGMRPAAAHPPLLNALLLVLGRPHALLHLRRACSNLGFHLQTRWGGMHHSQANRSHPVKRHRAVRCPPLLSVARKACLLEQAWWRRAAQHELVHVRCAKWQHRRTTLLRYSGSSHFRRMEAAMASRCA